jgi:hypothetical protein
VCVCVWCVAGAGGASLDLGGGDYVVSAPISIPTYYGNFRIVNGALRASATFPPGNHLIEASAWQVELCGS